MSQVLRKLDVLPGWKAAVTGALYALFDLLRSFGWVDVTEAQAEAANALVLALIVVFLAVKLERSRAQ